MSASDPLSVLVFGPSTDGYALGGAVDHLPRETIGAFQQFVKAIAWRPAKLEAPQVQGIALAPCPGGLFVCRIAEAEPDSFGRRPTIRVEGVLCPDDPSIWQPWLDLKCWPQTFIETATVSPLTSQDAGKSAAQSAGLPDGWTPTTGQPLVFLPDDLLAMPKGWSAVSARAPETRSERPAVRAPQTPPAGPVRATAGSAVPPPRPRSSVWLLAAVALGLGGGLGGTLGYLAGSRPLEAKLAALQAQSDQSEQWHQNAVRLESELGSLRADYERLRGDYPKEIAAWKDAALSLNAQSPRDLESALRQLFDEMDALKTRAQAEVRPDGTNTPGSGPTTWRWSPLPWLAAALGLCLGLALAYFAAIRPLQSKNKKLQLAIKLHKNDRNPKSRETAQ